MRTGGEGLSGEDAGADAIRSVALPDYDAWCVSQRTLEAGCVPVEEMDLMWTRWSC